MKKRWKNGFGYAFTGSVSMFIVSLILGSEPYWIGIIGFFLGGLTFGILIRPYLDKKYQEKNKNS
ncbi:hypothetical protein ACS127_02900 [Amphibacillus sp. Q70]|uniref:hypothetical protein n=1 Tax=Amphibacillus sp. Q70 TaxID=3453416 RepID=UPI003F8674A6